MLCVSQMSPKRVRVSLPCNPRAHATPATKPAHHPVTRIPQGGSSPQAPNREFHYTRRKSHCIEDYGSPGALWDRADAPPRRDGTQSPWKSEPARFVMIGDFIRIKSLPCLDHLPSAP
jgi:hypothetical protein